ncbi:DUF4232 domain-containing protein [Rhizohabitans arisaemae]|uniref:DUF4232 domain-containing protein n=1 Tax=Rhizohabitans arisaemae TaxID=2720610 RepID=UPI0024B0C006|nr:DUF4232 domain-containing protein [Rhizohabitans arisaemae]
MSAGGAKGVPSRSSGSAGVAWRAASLPCLAALSLLVTSCGSGPVGPALLAGDPRPLTSSAGLFPGASDPVATPPQKPAITGKATVQPPEPGTVERCRTDMLTTRSFPSEKFGEDGRSAQIRFQNKGPAPCWVYGYVGLTAIDADGNALRTETVRERQETRARVILEPGGAGEAWLRVRWAVVPAAGEEPCPRAVGLLIIPPDETVQVRAAFDGQICQRGRMVVTPLTQRPL